MFEHILSVHCPQAETTKSVFTGQFVCAATKQIYKKTSGGAMVKPKTWHNYTKVQMLFFFSI